MYRRPSVAVLGLTLSACGGVDVEPRADLLIFTRTNGYRHTDAIELASIALPARLAELGITVELTEDPRAFMGATGYRAVFFLYTSGNELVGARGKAAFEQFVEDGGGFIGLHSATDTEYDWPFYQDLVVAPFESHPAIQHAIVDIVDRDHPATAPLPPGRWPGTDEWYNFSRDPGTIADVRVLATLDETTYIGGTMGAEHPIVWSHDRLGGRAFYSALGHVAERWTEPAFIDHVIGGVTWVLDNE